MCPSSGACDCVDGLPNRLSCSFFVVCWGLLRMMFGGVRFALVLQPAKRTPPNIIRSKPQHTTKREQDNRFGNPPTQSQAPEDGHINVRNMLSK